MSHVPAHSVLTFAVEIVFDDFLERSLDEQLASTEDALEFNDTQRPPIKVPVALVKAFVSGQEPLVSALGRPLDALALLAQGAEPGELELYTCSCGVAGCADLQYPVQVAQSADTVTWTFPMQGYADHLTPAFQGVATGDALVLTFAKTQYFCALALLESHLMELAQTHALMQVAPCDLWSPERDSFAQVWPRMLVNARERRLRENAVAMAFQELAHQALVMSTPSGKFVLTPWQLRYVLAPEAARDLLSLRASYEAWSAAAALIRQEGVMAFLRAIDWDALRGQAWDARIGRVDDDVDAELPLECPPGFWDQTTAEFVTERSSY